MTRSRILFLSAGLLACVLAAAGWTYRAHTNTSAAPATLAAVTVTTDATTVKLFGDSNDNDPDQPISRGYIEGIAGKIKNTGAAALTNLDLEWKANPSDANWSVLIDGSAGGWMAAGNAGFVKASADPNLLGAGAEVQIVYLYVRCWQARLVATCGTSTTVTFEGNVDYED